VRNDLHELHQTLKFTSVYVTHDQSEAFALGDRLAVMRAGRIEQLGTAADVYERPATDYTANFVGMTNFVDFVRADDGWTVAGAEQDPVELPVAPGGDTARLRFRATDAEVVSDGALVNGVRLRGIVRDRVYTGHGYELAVAVGDRRLTVIVPSEIASGLERDAAITLQVSEKRSRWFTPDGESLLVRAGRQEVIAAR
jgi:iron(III) transport system ATP-binding protein